MHDLDGQRVAIIDYGMGNVLSVMNACLSVGLRAEITSSKEDVVNADAIILPGVGAFGSAMERLRKLKLIDTLRYAALSKPFLGICLGMQLLMSESYEFGHHKGLGLIEGKVVDFRDSESDREWNLKVPHVGWSRISCKKNSKSTKGWEDSLLKGLIDGEFMYFVHSFYVRPLDSSLILSMTTYGATEFCSSLQYANVFGCQFHPERSGSEGLKIYENLKSTLLENYN